MKLTFFFGFTVFANEMWFSLIVINDLQYGLNVLNGVMLGIGMVMVPPVLLLMVWKPPSKKLVFIYYVISIIVQIYDLTHPEHVSQ